MRAKVNLDEPYEIVFGKTEDFSREINDREFSKCILVTDSNAGRLHAGKLAGLRNSCRITFEAGESSKSLQTYEKIMEDMLSAGADRESLVIGLGGGVVGDMAGFVAGTYMRGVQHIHIPTTLLAMVDSSIGGKAAVDLKNGKNMAGLFYQPKAVYIDPDLLKTLPAEELKNGLVEVIKYSIISDSDFFQFLEQNIDKALALDRDVILECIKKSCEIKAGIVEKDEKERNLRMVLNYGHSIGHAIEARNDYKLKHGECVAEGMVKEAEVSNKMGFLGDGGLERIKKLIAKLNLKKPAYDKKITEIMKSDKKNVGGKIKLALPKKVGEAAVIDGVPLGIIGEVL